MLVSAQILDVLISKPWIWIPPGLVISATVLSISEVSEKDMRNLRGPEIAMILQEPMAHLNPVFTVGYQIGESLARHRHLKQDELQRDKRCPKGSSDTEPVEDKRQLPI